MIDSVDTNNMEYYSRSNCAIITIWSYPQMKYEYFNGDVGTRPESFGSVTLSLLIILQCGVLQYTHTNVCVFGLWQEWLVLIHALLCALPMEAQNMQCAICV